MNKLWMTTLAVTALVAAGCKGGDAPSSKTETKNKPAAASVSKDEIRVVGSSTVYPFSTKVAQEYRNKTGQNVVVEATGSGGGHKLFCEGIKTTTPEKRI